MRGVHVAGHAQKEMQSWGGVSKGHSRTSAGLKSLLNPAAQGDIILRQLRKLSLGGGNQPKVIQEVRAGFRQGLLGPTQLYHCALAMSSWKEPGLCKRNFYSPTSVVVWEN